jgi:hypothetical protein
MTINDIIQIFIVGLSLFGIVAWAWRLRRWPLMWAAAISLAFNIVVYAVRLAGYWTPGDLNQLSLVRILLLTIVICAVPFSTHELPK